MTRSFYLREAMPTPERPDQVWSMDFVHDRLVTGRRFKNLTMIDHCSRESPKIYANHSIRGKDVVAILERLRYQGRKPGMVVLDNGPEFTSKALAEWAGKNQVRLFFIEPGKPTQNAFIESFNGKFRNECLDQNWFRTIEEAQLITSHWRKEEYNNARPHSSLNGITPNEFIRNCQNNINSNSPSVGLTLVQLQG